MNRIAFSSQNSLPIKSILPPSIQFITLQCDELIGPRSITLWSSNKVGIRIQSRMHDLAERQEVGVLDFRKVEPIAVDEEKFELPFYSNRCNFQKLIINERDTSIESGIILSFDRNIEIIIVAGAFPYSLAIDGLNKYKFKFDPEYPIENYIREPLV